MSCLYLKNFRLHYARLMDKTAFLPLFVRRVRYYLRVRSTVPPWQIRAQDDCVRHAARRPKYRVGVFAICAVARVRCPAVWLHGVLLACLLQNIRAHLSTRRRRAFIIPFARFCFFSLFSVVLFFSPSFSFGHRLHVPFAFFFS